MSSAATATIRPTSRSCKGGDDAGTLGGRPGAGGTPFATLTPAPRHLRHRCAITCFRRAPPPARVRGWTRPPAPALPPRSPRWQSSLRGKTRGMFCIGRDRAGLTVAAKAGADAPGGGISLCFCRRGCAAPAQKDATLNDPRHSTKKEDDQSVTLLKFQLHRSYFCCSSWRVLVLRSQTSAGPQYWIGPG